MESLVLQINDTVLIFFYVIDLHRSCDFALCSPSTENQNDKSWKAEGVREKKMMVWFDTSRALNPVL